MTASPVLPETARIPFSVGLPAMERVTMAAWLPTPEALVAAKVSPCASADFCSPASTREMNDVTTGPVAMSMATTCFVVVSEYVQTIPVLLGGRSAAGSEIGAATVSPRPELTVPWPGQVRLTAAAVGVAVAAAVGFAVDGTLVAPDVDMGVGVGEELPQATRVAASATGTTAARRNGPRIFIGILLVGSASPSDTSRHAPDRSSIAAIRTDKPVPGCRTALRPSPFPRRSHSRPHHRQPDVPGALYVLAVTTGMRQGELLALRWRDVELDVYSHVTETMQLEAARTMDAILSESDPNRVGVNVGVTHQTRHQVDTRITLDSNSKQGWAGQDSNLGPWGYEPPALTG